MNNLFTTVKVVSCREPSRDCECQRQGKLSARYLREAEQPAEMGILCPIL